MQLKEEEQSLLQRAELGIDIERFFNEPVGKYVLSEMEQQRAAAFERFLTTPIIPTDPASIAQAQQIQVDALVADRVIQTLGRAIQDGRNAYAQLREETDMQEVANG